MIGMDSLNPATELAGMGAMLLFLSALWRRSAVRWGRNCAFLGVLILGGIAVYSHDVMNLPEICGIGVIGCAVGLVLGREWPVGRLPGLLAGSAAMAGLAGTTAALGAFLNPHAFGLLDDMTDRMMSGAAGVMAIVLGLGAVAGGGGVAIIGEARLFRGRAWMGCVSLALTGMAAVYFTNTLREPVAGMVVGLAFLSAMLLAPCFMAAGGVTALAIVSAVAGWSVAAMGFLLQDFGMVVSGGMAGGMAGTLALRLLRPAARKGLADSGSGA